MLLDARAIPDINVGERNNTRARGSPLPPSFYRKITADLPNGAADPPGGEWEEKGGGGWKATKSETKIWSRNCILGPEMPSAQTPRRLYHTTGLGYAKRIDLLTFVLKHGTVIQI